jgi:hypothetical protein
LREGAVTVRVFVSAKFQEILLSNDARQSKPFSPDSKPFAEHLILLVVVIAELQMLLEVFLRIAEVALCFDCQHAFFLTQPTRQSCNEFITMWSSEVRLNVTHEREAKACFFMARRTSNVR